MCTEWEIPHYFYFKTIPFTADDCKFLLDAIHTVVVNVTQNLNGLPISCFKQYHRLPFTGGY